MDFLLSWSKLSKFKLSSLVKPRCPSEISKFKLSSLWIFFLHPTVLTVAGSISHRAVLFSHQPIWNFKVQTPISKDFLYSSHGPHRRRCHQPSAHLKFLSSNSHLQGFSLSIPRPSPSPIPPAIVPSHHCCAGYVSDQPSIIGKCRPPAGIGTTQ